jgi:uncharacterized protein
MSVITNGLLLDKEKLSKLRDLNVSIAISIDGVSEKSNELRVDRNNNPVFNNIIKILKECKKNEFNISLSVTLNEETIKSVDDIIALTEKFNIKGLGFNIMMSDENFILPDEYNEKASQFIIDSFLELRKRGIYEDRMMRKLKSFSESKVYFSDCAATSGGQIVITPNGKVGICQGCLSDKKFFISNVDDKDFNATANDVFIEWANLSPINKDECIECSALGICGGGCPVNAMNSNKFGTIHSIDKRFCVHAKKTLEFLINDLYQIITRN